MYHMNFGKAPNERGYVPPRGVKGDGIAPLSMALDGAESTSVALAHLPRIGIVGLAEHLPAMQRALLGSAMDASPQSLITTASLLTPEQFLQNWLPGFVNTLTTARKIDELAGVVTAGDWEDEEIVQGMLEPVATSVPYSDGGDIPLSNYNAAWERRSIVRQEMGMQVGRLAEARASKVRINDADTKRTAVSLQLEITRNLLGFYGYNSGNNRTYGFLNDPNLPAATQFPAGASGSRSWNNKTFLEITLDIRLGVSALRTQSGDTVDPEKTDVTLGIPTDQIDALSTTAEYGTQSVREWLRTTYPRVRVVSAPEFTSAVGGVSVAYFYAETVNDTSTDDRRTWVQVVPAKFKMLGVEQRAKGYAEDYSMATAGCMLKRPYAVTRYLFG